MGCCSERDAVHFLVYSVIHAIQTIWLRAVEQLRLPGCIFLIFGFVVLILILIVVLQCFITVIIRSLRPQFLELLL